MVKKFRTIAWTALAAGIVAVLVVPFVVPIESSGFRTESEVAGPDATFLQVSDISVHHEYLPYQGAGSQPPLFVLLHGFGASTFSWREVLEDFSNLGDVLAYDRPAFGLTSRPTRWEGESPYGVDAQMELIDALVEAFRRPNQSVVLVGHSAGGTLSAEYALRNPEALSGLILVAPAILQTGGGPSWLQWIVTIPQVDRLGPLLVGGIATSGSELLERSWHDQNRLTAEIRAGYQQPLQVRGWEAAFWEFQKAPRNFSVTENPSDIPPPVFIITGDDDRVVPTDDSRTLQTLIPGAGLAVIPASGHLPQEETPEAFMAAVREALEHTMPEALALEAIARPAVSEVFSEPAFVDEGFIDCLVVPCVALSFDDGPGPWSSEILEVLSDYGAYATFYVVGRALKAWPSKLPLIVEAGHDIGNHTMTHPRLGELSRVAQQAEVQGLDDLVFAAVGIQPKTIRPPYGNLPVGGIADAHQRPVVLWSVDSLDWKNRTPSKIVSVVLEQAGPGDIILMHETSRRSVEALPQILEGLRDKGLTVVSVAQLLGTGYRSPEKIERVPYTCPTLTSVSGVNPWCVVDD